jgi:hypothetical protein
MIGYGGLAQFVAGVWEFAAGNTFGATAFCSYGGFWWSYAILFIPWFGISNGYATAAGSADAGDAMMANAVGLYLVAWFIFTFIMVSKGSRVCLTTRHLTPFPSTFSSHSSLLHSEVHWDWSFYSSSWTSLSSCSSLQSSFPLSHTFKLLEEPLVSLRLLLPGTLVQLVFSVQTPVSSLFPFWTW